MTQTDDREETEAETDDVLISPLHFLFVLCFPQSS